jgi:hypothetical protein
MFVSLTLAAHSGETRLVGIWPTAVGCKCVLAYCTISHGAAPLRRNTARAYCALRAAPYGSPSHDLRGACAPNVRWCNPHDPVAQPRISAPVARLTSVMILAVTISISASVRVVVVGCKVTATATDFLPSATPLPA